MDRSRSCRCPSSSQTTGNPKQSTRGKYWTKRVNWMPSGSRMNCLTGNRFGVSVVLKLDGIADSGLFFWIVLSRTPNKLDGPSLDTFLGDVRKSHGWSVYYFNILWVKCDQCRSKVPEFALEKYVDWQFTIWFVPPSFTGFQKLGFVLWHYQLTVIVETNDIGIFVLYYAHILQVSLLDKAQEWEFVS